METPKPRAAPAVWAPGRVLPPLLWALVCAFLLCFPVDQARRSAAPGLAHWQAPSMLEASIHAFLFFVQAALLFYAGLLRGRFGARGSLVASVLVSIFYGALPEGLQRWLPARSSQWEDVAANALGALLFGALVLLAFPGWLRTPGRSVAG